MRRSGALAIRLRSHRDELRLLAIQPQRGELAAPHATRVDGVDAESCETTERGPVSANDAGIARFHARYFEPRIQPRALRTGRALGIEIDAAVHIAITHAGEDVDRGAHPV